MSAVLVTFNTGVSVRTLWVVFLTNASLLVWSAGHNDVEIRLIPQQLAPGIAEPSPRPIKRYSLSDRLRLAQDVASAVLYVHSFFFVHMNVQSENIIVFEPTVSLDGVAPSFEEKHPHVTGRQVSGVTKLQVIS
jgi:hypothetical protein